MLIRRTCSSVGNFCLKELVRNGEYKTMSTLRNLTKQSVRRLQLVALDHTRPKDPPLSLGHASIFAEAKKQNIMVSENSFAVNQNGFSPADVVDCIMENSNKHTDVAFGVYIWNESFVQEILNELRSKKFEGRIILGGPQISYTKKGLESYYPQANVFIRGYAESALINLVKSGDQVTGEEFIEGVHFAGQEDKCLQAKVDLESLVSPYLGGTIQPQRFIRWETQRGCKFRCSFCQHREPERTKIRTKTFALERVRNETQWILGNQVIQDIAVLDPVFNSGPHHLEVLRSLRGYTGKLSLQCRTEMIKEDFLQEIVELNKTGRVVLELGLQTIHKNEEKLIDRGNNMRSVNEVLEKTRELGVETELSLIFGLPGQTPQSFQESVDYCVSRQVTKVHAFPLMLLRGTPLYENKEALGLVESHEVASDLIPRVQGHIPHVVQSRSFDHADWRRMAEVAADLETGYNMRL